jgi:putative acetyltransferase
VVTGFWPLSGPKPGLAGLNRNTIPRARAHAELGPSYVVPDAQGGGGVAAGLMAALLAYAEAQGIGQLDLNVNVENARAIAFYTRYGFVEAGRVPKSILGADGPEMDMIMIRPRT